MLRRAAFLAGLLVASTAQAAGPTADLARRIAEAGLDPDTCYRVRDFQLARGDLRIYLNDGYLILGKPVDGVRVTAAFTADTDGGDAEVILMPPTRSERQSLATCAKSPNLDEHFRHAVMLFTDNTQGELEERLKALGPDRRSAERGVLLAEEWNGAARSFAQSFQVRIVRDLLGDNRAQNGFFYTAVSGVKLGNFDAIFDPRSPQQITVGRVAYRSERAFFDTWTSFQSRAFRQGRRTAPAADLAVQSYHIEATLDPDLSLHARTRATVIPGPDGRRALSFDIASAMRVSEVRIDGVPAEVFQPESMRSTLLRGSVNETFLVVPEKPLEPGREYVVDFVHEGNVITDAGNKVYFVGARGAWYPNRHAQFARYEMAFRYPRDLDLVAAGKPVEASEDGQWRTARYRLEAPVRLAGFNLGTYEHQTVARRGYTIDVYANRNVETALEKPRIVIVPVPDRARVQPIPRWTVDLSPLPPDRIPKTTARLEELALQIAGALEFMADHFGPPVLRNLTVAPIPGTFGQGFPGLIYLSTLTYLNPAARPASMRGAEQSFYSELLSAHETAHQWWGNIVTSAGNEDEWIMEALANYSALLYLERKKGPRVAEATLADYRTHLLAKNEAGDTVESAGPIVWGQRLITSRSPDAWRAITYEKGSWIIHMLRRRMGDARFLEMLGQLRRRFQYKSITTDQFRGLAAEFLPARAPDPQLEAFFDQFVYGTGIPALKLNHNVKGKAPSVRVSGTITQTDVDADFSAYVPVEIQLPKGKPVVQWVRTSSEPTPFSVVVKQAPVRVLLDPGNSLLRK